MRSKQFLFATAAAAALAVAGVAAFGAAAAGASDSRAGAARVKVTLNEFKLIPSAKCVPVGQITFVVRNAGRIPHEFVVVRTKTPAAELPISGGAADETGSVGAITAFAPRTTKSTTLILPRGHYALICNLLGHYQAGQYADLRVGC